MSRSHSYILAAAAIAISAAACASDDSNDAQGALGDPNVVAKLRDLALELASYAGVQSPMKMYAVAASDHQEAEKILSGAIINDHAPVFIIVMTGGRFTAGSAPPGVPFPEGDVLTATVDAATYNVTDVGIVNVEPDLHQIALATVDLNAN